MTGIERAVDAVGGQRKLAALVGVRQPAVSKWVAAGRMPLDAQRVAKVSEVTGVPASELIASEVRDLLRGTK